VQEQSAKSREQRRMKLNETIIAAKSHRDSKEDEEVSSLSSMTNADVTKRVEDSGGGALRGQHNTRQGKTYKPGLEHEDERKESRGKGTKKCGGEKGNPSPEKRHKTKFKITENLGTKLKAGSKARKTRDQKKSESL